VTDARSGHSSSEERGAEVERAAEGSPVTPGSGHSASEKRRGEAERVAGGDPISDAGVRARYVAIITDGNGRWAQRRGLPVLAGHEAGADAVKARLRDAVELGVQELTVYSFSTENWGRSAEEVAALMGMFARRIEGETPELHAEGVRMRFIGRRSAPVPPALVERMKWAEEVTRDNNRITLFVAFNYGGRAEIVDAARTFTGGGTEDFRAHLYAPDMHDPDLIIRTSGEQRISNYLLWQAAYSELVFREELWPDFSRAAFEQSLEEFAARRRRFGGR
jgi:undecaprenyl diphosphate synthase